MPEQPNPYDVFIVGSSLEAMHAFSKGEPPEFELEVDAFQGALEGLLNRTYRITHRRINRDKKGKILRALSAWSPPDELSQTAEDAQTQLVLKTENGILDVSARRAYYDTDLGRITTLPGAGVLFVPQGPRDPVHALARNSRGKESERRVPTDLNKRSLLLMNSRVVYFATPGSR